MAEKPSWPWKLPSAFLKNTAGLYLDTFTSYLFPLITLPYVVRVLGARGFGVVAFAQSFVSYVNVMVDFALTLSGTRAVAQCAHDREQSSQVVANALALRLALAIAFFPVVMVLCHSFAAFREAKAIILILYATAFATALSASWVFLAFEAMWLLARINFVINVAVIVGIFALVRSPEDTETYAALLAAGPLAGSVASLFLAFRWFSLCFKRPTWAGVARTARQGGMLFLSQLSIALYTTGNAFLLGTLASKEAVGYFAAADKVVRAVLRLVSPLTTAIFPRMVHAAQRSTEELAARARTVLSLYGALGASLALALWFGAPWVVGVFFGPGFSPAGAVLRISSTILFLVALSNVLGVHVLLPAGRDRAFTAITVAAGAFNVLFAWLLVPRWQAQGMAWAVVSSEALVTLAMAAVGWKLLVTKRVGRGKAYEG
ncbi:MAG: flippase [Thermoanaerobaculum sp.]